MEEEIVVADNSNTAEETVELLNDSTEEATTQDVDVEDVRSKLAKAEELANNYKIRAEKAEKIAKQTPKEDAKQVNISTSDIIALTRANIHEDDIADVQEYARFKGISVKDALNSSVIKTLLSENAEKRNVANATNTANVRRGPTQASEETLISKAQKGELPTNENDMIRLIKARKGLK